MSNTTEERDNSIEEITHKNFIAVIKTLKGNKIMVKSFPDGIYIRLAGSIHKGESFTEYWAKALPFTDYQK